MNREGVMEDVLTDDQSHYEISLTAGQAFVAFVLMLLSLAASFAFGLTIGKGQLEEKIAGKRDAPAIVVAPKKPDVAVNNDDFKQVPAATITEEPSVAPPTPAARPAAQTPLPKPSTNP